MPCYVQVDTLYAGEVGYLAAQIKSVQDARVGDTVTLKKSPAAAALEGYEDVQPMVYCGLFPTDADDYQVTAAAAAAVADVLFDVAHGWL
jgi:GTP-binding protein LepA